MLKNTEPILRVDLEESLGVIMTCNTVLQGMAYRYYTTVNINLIQNYQGWLIDIILQQCSSTGFHGAC